MGHWRTHQARASPTRGPDLYRLLVLYAEDRGLLPVNDSRYDDYGLRRVRDDIRAGKESRRLARTLPHRPVGRVGRSDVVSTMETPRRDRKHVSS